jgi:hypothetical protein
VLAEREPAAARELLAEFLGIVGWTFGKTVLSSASKNALFVR